MRCLYKIIAIVIYFLFTVLISCGGSEESKPESLIFSDVKAISLYGPEDREDIITNGDKFTFYIPPEVAYAVLGIFSQAIETGDQTILNEENFVAGTRSGLEGFNTSNISKNDLYIYDINENDFDMTQEFSTTGTYHWAVWGYDKQGILTHASPQREVYISYINQ